MRAYVFALSDKSQMTRRLVVHFGLPKTGSSTIQSFLLRNSQILQQTGTEILSPAGRACHEVLANELLNLDERGGPASTYSARGSVHDFLPSWSEFATQILSMETFHSPGPLAVRRLRDHAAEVDASIEVVGFFRSPELWLWSFWAQETKSVWIDWCSYLERVIAERCGLVSTSLASWADECPGAQFRVRSYEGPDLVRRFLSLIAIPQESLDFNTPDQNLGESRLEVVRRAAIVQGIWDELQARAVLASIDLDAGLAARLVLEATQNQAIGFESVALHRSSFPDLRTDPTFNSDSHPLIAEYARQWGSDAQQFIAEHGERFDAESHVMLRKKISAAQDVAARFGDLGGEPDAGPFPRRGFQDGLPTNAWEIALIRGVASALFGALLYSSQQKDFGGHAGRSF